MSTSLQFNTHFRLVYMQMYSLWVILSNYYKYRKTIQTIISLGIANAPTADLLENSRGEIKVMKSESHI